MISLLLPLGSESFPIGLCWFLYHMFNAYIYGVPHSHICTPIPTGRLLILMQYIIYIKYQKMKL